MSTYYTVGGMPLAFTQKDFLVCDVLCVCWLHQYDKQLKSLILHVFHVTILKFLHTPQTVDIILRHDDNGAVTVSNGVHDVPFDVPPSLEVPSVNAQIESTFLL